MNLAILKLIMIADCLPPSTLSLPLQKLQLSSRYLVLAFVGTKISDIGDEGNPITGGNGRNPSG